MEKKTDQGRVEWRFTEDEKNHFRTTFKAHGISKGVEPFIDKIEFYCYADKILRGQDTADYIEVETEKVLKKLKATLKVLEKISSVHNEMRLWRYEHIGDDSKNRAVLAYKRNLYEGALRIRGPLDELIKTIADRPNIKQGRRGQPRGNKTRLEDHVLRTYRETVSKSVKKELFKPLLEIVREAIGRKHSDISRTISALLK